MKRPAAEPAIVAVVHAKTIEDPDQNAQAVNDPREDWMAEPNETASKMPPPATSFAPHLRRANTEKESGHVQPRFRRAGKIVPAKRIDHGRPVDLVAVAGAGYGEVVQLFQWKGVARVVRLEDREIQDWQQRAMGRREDGEVQPVTMPGFGAPMRRIGGQQAVLGAEMPMQIEGDEGHRPSERPRMDGMGRLLEGDIAVGLEGFGGRGHLAAFPCRRAGRRGNIDWGRATFAEAAMRSMAVLTERAAITRERRD